MKEENNIDELIRAVKGLTVATYKLIEDRQDSRENPEGFVSQSLIISTADVAVKLPYREIPYDHEVAVKALSTNAGLIRLANSKSDAEDASTSFSLANGESITYKVRNVNNIWAMATTANDVVTWTVERKKIA